MSDEKKVMRYETQIQMVPNSMKQLNEQFALVDILLCYHGKNRNYTSMSKEVIEAALPSLYGIPIVGEYIYLDDGSQDFGSHGGKIIISNEGIKFEDTTKPFGFVTKDAVESAKWVTIKEKNGITEHEYLELKGCIVWSKRYEEVNKILESNYGQSMEIALNDVTYDDDGYCIIKDFTFSAACILGSNPDGTEVIPCFESACIGRHYELDSFKKEFSLMLDEYKKFNMDSDLNKKQTNQKKEDIKLMELSKINDVLSTRKIGDTENNKYALLSANDDMVYALDLEGYIPCGFKYAIVKEDDVENIIIDFESRVEMSLSATEKIENENFKEFSISEVVDKEVKRSIDAHVKEQTAILEEEFNKKVDELSEQYSSLSDAHKIALEKLDKFEEAEAQAKAAQHEKDVEELFNKFSAKLSKCAEFLVYKAKVKPEEVTVDEVEEKLTLMAGKYAMESAKKKNFSYQPPETGAKKTETSEAHNRYGSLLDKFMK